MATSRSIAADLVRLLSTSDAPLYVLNDERTIVFCNAACARLFNVEADALVGQTCAFHSPEVCDSIRTTVATLCPPPQVFMGQTESAIVTVPGDLGQPSYRRAHYLPLADGDDGGAAVLVVFDPRDCPQPPAADPLPTNAQLHEEIRRFRAQMIGRYRPDSLLGNHPSIVRARAQIQLASTSTTSVLVTGPPGSGREHVARAIHYAQPAPGTLLPLDCAVLETNVIRSSLRAFWSRNAHTHEHGVTLLLLDIENLALEAQSDLADILHAGSERIRIVSTAAAPLEDQGGKVRLPASLACTLSTLTIALPPLAARRDDLSLLAQAFLEQANALGGKQVAGFVSAALDRLHAYPWPGNLDELAAMVREAHTRAHGTEIVEADLPRRLHSHAETQAHPRRVVEPIDLAEVLARVERELIERALAKAKGNKSQAARLVGLSRQRLLRRMVQLGLARPDEAASMQDS